MSMADDLRELKKYARTDDAVGRLAAIKLIVETIQTGAELTLGVEHLGMALINEKIELVMMDIDELHGALKILEGTVKNIANDVLTSLGENPGD